ncbi:PTS IIA-like nitrogen regulatory protein PtsN [Luteithermobacter gelatinilyticus]|uniref:PTS IIA-like nitrogen regulatory protein PtsN n=1 Tax=Luteithermobacter gelatinilyticus TaxID=2582913 RepID=UPI00110674D6|nr:PTS IIA-like nitrogen regulatory protein PtsN [Luteithermobacter gelatinilyticus]|tara:strand:- start:486 stop:953 length:468 start_codon:yes stop_codon:yes gene_type:complete
MDIADLISLESIIPDMKATSKKQILQELATIAEKIVGRPAHEIVDVLVERERLGTTGVGHGVAIPHGKINDLDRLYGFFARLKQPVDFDSLDGEPVDLIFMLLAPESAGADHLKALAKVSRLLRDKSICEKLRGSEGGDAIYAILTASYKNSHAA